MNAAGPLAHLIAPKHRESKDLAIACTVCKKPTTMDGWLVGILRTWNENLDRQEHATKHDLITPADVEIPCSHECASVLYARKHRDEQAEGNYSIAVLRAMHAGDYTADTLSWLRSHGYGEQVTRYLSKGTPKK